MNKIIIILILPLWVGCSNREVGYGSLFENYPPVSHVKIVNTDGNRILYGFESDGKHGIAYSVDGKINMFYLNFSDNSGGYILNGNTQLYTKNESEFSFSQVNSNNKINIDSNNSYFIGTMVSQSATNCGIKFDITPQCQLNTVEFIHGNKKGFTLYGSDGNPERIRNSILYSEKGKRMEKYIEYLYANPSEIKKKNNEIIDVSGALVDEDWFFEYPEYSPK